MPLPILKQCVQGLKALILKSVENPGAKLGKGWRARGPERGKGGNASTDFKSMHSGPEAADLKSAGNPKLGKGWRARGPERRILNQCVQGLKALI